MAAFALSFAACSDDDDVRNANSEPKPGEKGALVEGISINFGESETAHTRAYSGSQTGEGTEGMIYEAYIFAKEANPTHTRPLDGDWTVLRVTADQTNKSIVVETGGVDTEKTAKADLKIAINENSKKEVEWLVQNVASFKGVRQGDYVYVIANDPNLTLSQAATLAHKGEASEDGIKGYIANINKDYLNKLTYPADAKNDKGEKIIPTGKFFMAGREMIPVSPNIPSNGDFSMTIGLDREVAKVNFSASISTNDADAAKGKVAFQAGDGIVVARIARKASPFAEQTPDWYVPANNCVEDWPINDHSLVNGVYSAFCDGTAKGSFVFDGTSATPITDWIAGTTISAGFNGVAPASSVTEYRYSWKLKKNDADMIDNSNMVYLSGDKGTIFAPMFYTTPNYSNNTNSVTVICTQATYTARGVFALSDITDKHIDAVLAADQKDIILYTADELKKLKEESKVAVNSTFEANGVTMPNMLMQKFDATTGQFTDSNIISELKAAIGAFGLQTVSKEVYEAASVDGLTVNYEDYKSYMDRFYAAVMIQQRLDNKMTVVAGSMAAGANKKENWGNGIQTGKTALLASVKQLAATDSLLAGWTMSSDAEPVRLANAFYIDAAILSGKTQKEFSQAIAQFVFEGAKNRPGVETVGIETRPEYFGKADAYEYIKGQKLYYRADVANYVSGVSNKLTERNMYYVSKGTIQSLGAKSIHDAIYSDQNTMHIDVTVNDWRLSVNEIPM